MTAEKKKREFSIGAVISKPGSTLNSKTGGWRTFRPVIEQDKCKKCGICWMNCPDNAIKKKGDKFTVDYDYCKGCLICMKQCPFNAIRKEVEEK